MAKSFLGITSMVCDQLISSLGEERNDFRVDFLQLFNNTEARSLDDLLGLGHANFLHGDAGNLLDVLEGHLLLVCVESDAHTRTTSSRRSSRAMDVSLRVLWWFNLNHKVHRGDIQTSGGDVSCDKDVEFLLLKTLQRDFSLVLSDVTMHHLDAAFNLLCQKKLVRLCLLGAEYDCLA